MKLYELVATLDFLYGKRPASITSKDVVVCEELGPATVVARLQSRVA